MKFSFAVFVGILPNCRYPTFTTKCVYVELRSGRVKASALKAALEAVIAVRQVVPGGVNLEPGAYTRQLFSSK